LRRNRQPKDRGPATSAARADRPFRTTLVLFDIDGTLVLTGGAGGRAMSLAFQELFAVNDAFRGIPMPGRTDAAILTEAATAHGLARDSPTLACFPDVYLRHLATELEKPGPRKGVMPGIRVLLDALAARPDVFLSLLTGNFERAAQLKLEYFDLWRYFSAGAFGDGAADRNGLVAKAAARVVAQGGPSVPASDIIVIGDTPLDVACAQAAGARSIAVATGSHTVGQLEAAGADAVFEDLSDTPRVLREMLRAEV
jgi:phosphoglycolate phosphatase